MFLIEKRSHFAKPELPKISWRQSLFPSSRAGEMRRPELAGEEATLASILGVRGCRFAGKQQPTIYLRGGRCKGSPELFTVHALEGWSGRRPAWRWGRLRGGRGGEVAIAASYRGGGRRLGLGWPEDTRGRRS